MTVDPWLGLLGVGSIPALPQASVMHLGLVLGWALVLAWIGVWLTRGRRPAVRIVVATALALWASLPGPVSLTYWLGLAFHAPSLSAVLWCGIALRRDLWPCRPAHRVAGEAALVTWGDWGDWWVLGGVLLGYLLLLDTFAVLPWAVYAWGFSPLAMVLTLLLFLLPFVRRAPWAQGHPASYYLLPAVVVLFVLTRLPIGNLWDALLDPWLWVVLHVVLVRALLRRLRCGHAGRPRA